MIRYFKGAKDLPNDRITTMQTIGDRVLLVNNNTTTTNSSILEFRQHGQTAYPFKGNLQIISAKEDYKGYLWIGTDESLVVVDSARSRMWKLDTSSGLADNFVENISEKNGDIIICTNGGYNLYSPENNEMRRLQKKDGLPSDTIFDLNKDRAGNEWIAGLIGGIVKHEKKSGLILQLSATDGPAGNTVIQSIEANGKIWINNAESGPMILDPENNTIQFIKNLPEINKRGYKEIFKDSEDNFWISGYPNYGVFYIDLKNRTITHLTTREGLADNSIFSTLEYDGKHLITSETDTKVLTTTPGDSENRWQISTMQYSGQQKKSGRTFASDAVTHRGNFLWGDNSLYIIHDINADTSSGKTLLNGVTILDKRAYFFKVAPGSSDSLKRLSNEAGYTEKGDLDWDELKGPFHLPTKLSIPYDQNVIRFHFTELGAGRGKNPNFAYVLEGFDKKWTITNELASNTYLNLNPGDYVFKVSSQWKNGTWNTPASFSFTIRPPWYQTWWAWLIYVVVALALLRFYIAFRSRKLIRENKTLEEKVNQRTQELQRSYETLKSTQAQLIHSEKMASLGELTAGVAHEIQNPLNFVNNFSEINKELIEELKIKNEELKIEDEEVKELLGGIKDNSEKINQHGQRASAIVKGMLEHSRTSTGQKVPADINKLADEYLRLAYHGLRAKDKSFNATIKTDFDETLSADEAGMGKINIVPQDIGRVLLNLFNNAFYTVQQKGKEVAEQRLPTVERPAILYDPTVSVATKKSGESVIIPVTDNGNGIPEKIKEKIFQPFFTTKPTGEGTGLGLSLSYDMVKAHGGEIKVESTPGEGTTFVVTLPVV